MKLIVYRREDRVFLYILAFCVLFVLFLTISSLLSPTPSFAQCQTNDRNQGLISAGSGITGFFGTSPGADPTAGVCVTGNDASYREFKVPGYQDIEDQFYTFNRSLFKKSDLPQGSLAFSGDGLYLHKDDLTINSSYSPTGSGAQVIFIRGNLNIEDNINYADTDSSSGLVFIVQGNINIYSTVTQVNAVLISSGIICTSYIDGSGCSDGTAFNLEPLVVNGSLISLNKAPVSGYAIEFKRNLEVNDRPAEVINKQPKYLYILRNGLFTKDLVITTEDQHYPMTTSGTPALSVNGSCKSSPAFGTAPNAPTTYTFTGSIVGRGPYQYNWYENSTLLGNSSDPSFSWTYTQAGTKTASLIISDLGNSQTPPSLPITCSTFTVGAAPPPLPAGWTAIDIGNPLPAGTTTESSGTWTVGGGGNDISGNTDSFRYVYRDISGNYTVTARVTAVQNTNTWAKAGVMIRDGVDASAMNAAIFLTPGQGVNFQWRNSTSGTTTNVATASTSPPKWLRISRSGNDFSAYYSDDGTNWAQLGTTQTINMPAAAKAGMGVTSHNQGTLNTSTLDNVSVTAGALNPLCDVGAIGINNLVGCYWDWTNTTNYFETLWGNAATSPTLTSPVPDTATALDINWATGAPNGSVGIDTFSAKWKGNFTFKAGTYNFTGGSDDGIRVRLLDSGTGQVLQQTSDAAEWINRGFSEHALLSYTFTSQTTARIEVDFYEDNAGARVKLGWNYTAPPPPIPNLVAQWKMDETSWVVDCLAGTVLDSGPYSKHGKSCPGGSGPTTTTGQGGIWGRAGNFDGIDDYAEAPGNTTAITTQITLTSWIKKAADNDWGGIVAKTDGGGLNYDYGLVICNSSLCGSSSYNNKLSFYSSGPAVRAISDGSVTGTGWHFIAVVRSGSVLTFYIDGAPSGSRLFSGNFPNTSSRPVRIGTDGPGWGSQAQFNGGIDDVRIYDRALSGSEIATIMGTTPVSPSSFRVFVTNTAYDGNLKTAGSNVGLGTAGDGLIGADKLCQSAANSSSLGGTWKAWISNDVTSASSRLNHNAGKNLRLLDGTKIANDLDNLISTGAPTSAINLTETGVTLSGNNSSRTWTNTNPNGTVYDIKSCDNWTSSSTSLSNARIGSSWKTDALWTEGGTGDKCDQLRHIYCFEQ